MRNKFFAKKVYIVPGHSHKFRTEHDALFFCNERGIDPKTIERYDSDKEYNRWLELQELEKAGQITELSRQVEYELIPAHYETIHVRDKKVKKWQVESGVPFLDPDILDTRKEAEALCKKRCIPYKEIIPMEVVEPVYKQVCIEQNAVYTADFVYKQDGVTIVEDCKSDYTRKEKDYVLRRKLMLHVHGIRVLET